ncbi:signal peptide peptidase SppA [Chryseolinea sp. T2]|uniref:signal peptide peptidase SppA n=1 Tax=Chryseolinea sp. T2 TaxID=3129255 RepID=UPI003078063F
MNFFKSFFASCLGSIVAMVVVIFGLIWIISLSGGDEVLIDDNSVLHLDLDVPIVETEREDPFAGVPFFGGDAPRPVGLAQLRQAIQKAKDDQKVKGIYLTVSSPQAGYAVIEELRKAILDFRTGGKWVIAFSEGMTEQAYYLASSADKIYLHPEGDLEFNGLAIDVTFFKRLFDKLEIKPEIFRVGEFKSAVEPFMLEKMSEQNRLQLTELIESLNDQVISSVASARNLPVERVKEISDKMLVHNPAQAKEVGLIDSLAYADQVEDIIRKRAGVDKLSLVKYSKYSKTVTQTGTSKNEVAVIVAEGTIVSGKADASRGVIASESFIKVLRKAREDEDVKAVVLRINSPGGSSLASDAMWREITLTSQSKPVIASMSDYAASGGYYMAMGCDTIVAQPHTITGSIGVFSVLYDASGFLGNKLGITSEELKTGEIGELVTISRPLNEVERSIWQQRTEEVYDTFTKKAAEGRKTTQDAIKAVASGRVWSGLQAKERGLVDIIGTFEDAVKVAAAAADLKDDYKVRIYPRYTPSLFEQIATKIEEDNEENAIRAQLGEYYYLYQQMKEVKSYQGTQARMPYSLRIH